MSVANLVLYISIWFDCYQIPPPPPPPPPPELPENPLPPELAVVVLLATALLSDEEKSPTELLNAYALNACPEESLYHDGLVL